MTTPAFLHPFAAPARTDFTTIVRGEGAIVYDADGKDYVDAMASLWYMNIGHGRQEMADVIAAQVSKLAAFHTFEMFTNEPADELAGFLAERAPVDDPRVFFVNSGSEAVDSAIKLARQAHVRAGEPQRTLVISRSRGYHGVTYGGMSVQGLPANQEGFGPLVGDVVNLPADDLEAVASLFAERGDQVAAVMVEPLQGAGGVFPPPDGYLAGLHRLCRQHGAFLIADEVITAFGRLGRWFGSEEFELRPDLITFAKAVTSGYIPLGGVVVGARVREPLEADPDFLLRHGHTYSGHPTAAAAGLEALAITEREDLLSRGLKMGERLRAGLRSLADDGLVAEVRGKGAVWAVGLRADQDAPTIRDRMVAAGVIPRPIGPPTLAFCPPLVTTDSQVDRIVDSLAAAL